MKSKSAFIGLIIGVVALLATFEYGHAQPTISSLSKIGVVSVRNVFNGSQQQARYRSQVLAQQSQSRAQLEDLAKEIAAEEAEMKTLLPGTPDHLKRLQSVLEKQAKLQSQQEYLKQQSTLENKQWMEMLYRETLKIVNILAQEKGLDLVLERTDPVFPISSEELMATFSTHKVLYSGRCLDLTAEVISRLDAIDTLKP